MARVSRRFVGLGSILAAVMMGIPACEVMDPGNVTPECTVDEDCEEGFACVEEACTEIPEPEGPEVTLGFLETEGDGTTYRVVENGGEMRLIPGFQGVSHIFVTLEFRGVPFTTTAGVTWTVTRISDGSLLSRTEIPLPETFISTPDPDVFQVQDLFVLFPGPATVLGGSEVELVFTLSEADGTQLLSIIQNAVLTVMQ